MNRLLIFLLAVAGVMACGVKGDPVPPGTPAELGRGQPTYKKATEEFAFPDVPPIYEEKKDKKDEKKDGQ